MLATALQELIANGLSQPKGEPNFFQYPVGYSMLTPTTGYSTAIVVGFNDLNRGLDAKLESGSLRAAR
jgi:hypothetical protein